MMIVYAIKASASSPSYVQGMVWAPSVTDPLGGSYRDFIWSFVPKEALGPNVIFEEETRETQIKYGVLERTILISDAQLTEFNKTGTTQEMRDYRRSEKEIIELSRKEALRLKMQETARFEAKRIREEEESDRLKIEKLKENERLRFAAEPFPRYNMSLEGALEVGSPGIFQNYSWGRGLHESKAVRIRFEAMKDYIHAVDPDKMGIEAANEIWRKIRKEKVAPYDSGSRYNTKDLVNQMHGYWKEPDEGETMAFDYLSGIVAAQLLAGGFNEDKSCNYVCYRRPVLQVIRKTGVFSFTNHIEILLNDYERLFSRLNSKSVLSRDKLKEILESECTLIDRIFTTYSGYAYEHADVPRGPDGRPIGATGPGPGKFVSKPLF